MNHCQVFLTDVACASNVVLVFSICVGLLFFFQLVFVFGSELLYFFCSRASMCFLEIIATGMHGMAGALGTEFVDMARAS